jgi:hypothetical protein
MRRKNTLIVKSLLLVKRLLKYYIMQFKKWLKYLKHGRIVLYNFKYNVLLAIHTNYDIVAFLFVQR